MLDVVAANRERDLYLTDGSNVYYIPQGWCDGWSVALGFDGGLDYVDEEDGPAPEIYCYAPLNVTPNSEVDTLFVRVETLQAFREINEREAKSLHPQLFSYLDSINQG